MKKLFENVNGNQFRLLTESIETKSSVSDVLREGLKKVMAGGKSEISYRQLENLGLGFIKDVTEARKCALRESRGIASQYGYSDDQVNSKFIKEDGEMSDYDRSSYENGAYQTNNTKKHPESDMSNPEENREVQIGMEILKISEQYGLKTSKHELPEETSKAGFNRISELAQELIELHKQ